MSDHGETTQLIVEEDDYKISSLSTRSLHSTSSHVGLKTTALIVLQLFLTIAVIPLCFVLPNILHNEPSNGTINFTILHIELTSVYVTIYINLGVWLFIFLNSGILKWIHKSHKLIGYIHLHKRLNLLKYIPFLTFTTGNAALLLYSLWILHKENPPTNDDKHDKEIRQIILEVIICVQCAIAIFSQLAYLYIVIKFNMSKVPPDIYNEILVNSTPMLYSALHSNAITISSGHAKESQLRIVCESQNDIIEYLKQRCAFLESKVTETSRHESHS